MTRCHREYLVSQGVPPGLSGLPRKWTVAAEPGAMGGGGVDKKGQYMGEMESYNVFRR